MCNNIGEVPIDRRLFESIVRQLTELKMLECKKKVATSSKNGKKDGLEMKLLVKNTVDYEIIVLLTADDITNSLYDDDIFIKFSEAFN